MYVFLGQELAQSKHTIRKRNEKHAANIRQKRRNKKGNDTSANGKTKTESTKSSSRERQREKEEAKEHERVTKTPKNKL